MILRAKNLCLLALKVGDAFVMLIPMRRASFYLTNQILQKIE
jgi:hypothetical protein